VTVVLSVTVEGPEPDAIEPTDHVTVRVPDVYDPPPVALTKSSPVGSTSVITAFVTSTAESFEYVIV